MLLLANSSRLAYVARVYYPAGDRRKSHFQVYLADLHGEHCRRVTTGDCDCRIVRWLVASTLAWTRDDGTLWRMSTTDGHPRLWKREKSERMSIEIFRTSCATQGNRYLR